ncbi:helix-turn-helix domain-containing protein [Lacrimispora sp. NSJ-141]|uniref:Helix-turn-helix domain-containing protein n=1 Tax=Lientehia hominis TaxID=2897778 RepID=A0AAP2RKI0_9FIRM|nr:helix-turn-helix domain-containing protein [Lientehia hominis]MCD2492443.1 helix-turn-helix domain-containing protein [Lientehia hominis]
MPIQNIIKERRKALGLTQEQVADYLGVSTPAVNKWENGATNPDIALLPPLARLLQTDLNTLLCFHEEVTDQEIVNFSNEVMEIIKQEGFDKGLSKVRKIIKEYPNSTKLIHNMALLLEGAMIMAGMMPEDKEKYDEPINSLYERAAQSSDESIRMGARFMLASKYITKENFEKAQEMLNLLPEPNVLDKRQLQASLLEKEGKTEEAEKIHERLLYWKASEIWSLLLTLSELEQKTGNHLNAARFADICSQCAELFEFPDYHKIIPQFLTAVSEKEEKKSIFLMESLLDSAEKTWKFSDTYLYRHLSGKEQAPDYNSLILTPLLKLLETDPKCEFLKKNERYRVLLSRYQSKISAAKRTRSPES